MATTGTSRGFGWIAALALPLVLASAAPAQPMVYPVYGPWGVYYVPYLPSSPVVQTSARSSRAYGDSSSGSDSRPSYYSEDYSGPDGPSSEPSKVAYIRVRVPASAEIWINDQKRTQRGAVRDFVTPALDPDHIYVYNVKARWTEEGGINVEKTLRVRTISGTRVTVNFVRPPASQPRPSAQTVSASAAPSAPRSSAQVERKPVDFITNAAPRSLRGPSP